MSEPKYMAWDKLSKSMFQVTKMYEIKPGTGILGKKDCIIRQFTGLKDKNGKEIYWGDIIKFQYKKDSPIIVVPVIFERGSFVVGYDDGSIETLSNFDNDHFIFEVVGNIYKNPELLDGVKK